jgi:hypothetical protein
VRYSDESMATTTKKLSRALGKSGIKRTVQRSSCSVAFVLPLLLADSMNLYRVLADVVVIVHAAYVGFVLFGLLAVLLGYLLGWQWVRNFWFRVIHLVMIGVVAAESLLGIECPLTAWENQLRKIGGGQPRPDGFIAYWSHELIFFEAPTWVFTVAYCVFGGLVVAAWFLVRPRLPGK